MSSLKDNLEEIQNQIGYKFKNSDLLFQAFTRRSYSKENGGENNETLEFVGDRVLDFYVTKILMDNYGYMKSELDDYDSDEGWDEFAVDKYDNEGKLTNIKKRFVNKKMLAHRIDLLDFQDYLFMGKGDIKQNKQNEESVKEDLFEAILGAIAIDSNWDQESLENSVSFMLNIDHYLNNGFNEDEDYVGLVQQWNQKEHGDVPVYEFQETYSGEYKAYLQLQTQRGYRRYTALGRSKSEARLNVAEEAYNDLDSNSELFTIIDELPEELTLANAINTLQELAQKEYISIPEYFLAEEPQWDFAGNYRWSARCVVSSERVDETVVASSKKEAKKYVAYRCICKICGLEDEYETK